MEEASRIGRSWGLDAIVGWRWRPELGEWSKWTPRGNESGVQNRDDERIRRHYELEAASKIEWMVRMDAIVGWRWRPELSERSKWTPRRNESGVQDRKDKLNRRHREM